MSEGSKTRRAFPIGTRIFAVVILAAGCEQIPVPRPNAAPIHLPPLRPKSALPDSTPQAVPAAQTESPQSAQTPPTTASAVQTPPAPTPVPTPTIDEALAGLNGRGVPEIPMNAEPAASRTDASPVAGPQPAAPVEPETTPLPLEALATTPLAATPAKADGAVATVSAVSEVPQKPAEGPPAAINPDKPANPTPKDVWRDGVEGLRVLAHDKEGSAEPDSPWALRARVLESLTQADEVDASHQSLWKTVLTALAATNHREASDDHGEASEIRAAVDAFQDQAPLEILELRLCRKVNGFGSFEPLEPAACKPGQSLIVYCEISGLRYGQSGEFFRSRVLSQVELVPAQGGEAVWKQVLGTAEDLCRRRRRDFFINYRIALPDNLPAGTYDLRLTQTDELAGRTSSARTALVVQP
jgi:hypothetical protein